MATRASTSVRLDDSQVARLDRIVDGMQARLAGLNVGRSTALRLALERGMDALDLELGLRVKRPTKGKRPPARPAKANPPARPAKANPPARPAKTNASRAKPPKAKAKQANATKTKTTTNQRKKRATSRTHGAAQPLTRRRERARS